MKNNDFGVGKNRGNRFQNITAGIFIDIDIIFISPYDSKSEGNNWIKEAKQPQVGEGT